MKIAVTCENHQVFQHFGHTPEFAIFETESGKITSEKIISTGDSGHGALAALLAQEKVDALICGGIGGGAQMALAAAGIRLCGGVSGDADSAVAALLEGNLSFDPDVHCDHHDHQHHEGSCGEHGCGGHSCGQH